MAKPFKGTVNIDIKDSTPDWEPYTQPIAPKGAPNVLYVVLDDVGFSAMEPYGGLIETPNIKRIADRGLTYTNFHTTALCSPTRSCLMTGRNHTRNGMACITEATSGFPNANGHIPFENANIAEVLGQHGWNTYIVGKWHLCAEDEMNLASSKRQWPLGRGFERYYGFLGGETNQWYPDLVYDNHPVAQPALPEDGYHLSVDLTDKAIEFIQDAKAVAPDKPFMLYYCPGAAHAPHHVPREWADKYKGVFDMGYEAYRDGVLERQKAMGLLPEGVELSPRDPYADTTSHDGKTWSLNDRVRPWDSLSVGRAAAVLADGRGLRRFPEPRRPPAGSPARLPGGQRRTRQHDHRPGLRQRGIGRGRAERLGQREQVLQRHPGLHRGEPQAHRRAGEHEDLQPLPDGLGVGLQHAVQAVEAVRQLRGRDGRPLIVAWPKGVKAAGEYRRQYTHAIDIVPTLYECLGIEMPEVVNGYTQSQLDGVSFRATLDDADATTAKETQFYSMLGTRAIWHKGWKAATAVPAAPESWGDFNQQRWELYDTTTDPSECQDLAADHPDKLQDLIALWWAEAGANQALPLESRGAIEILGTARPELSSPRSRYVYYPGGAEVPESSAPNIRNRSYTVGVEVDIASPEASGVLFSQGSRFGGHALYVKDGLLDLRVQLRGRASPGDRVRANGSRPGTSSCRRRSSARTRRCPPRAC